MAVSPTCSCAIAGLATPIRNTIATGIHRDRFIAHLRQATQNERPLAYWPGRSIVKRNSFRFYRRSPERLATCIYLTPVRTHLQSGARPVRCDRRRGTGTPPAADGKGLDAGAVRGSRAGDALRPHAVPLPGRPCGPTRVPPAGRSHAAAHLLRRRSDHHVRPTLRGGSSAPAAAVGHARTARPGPGAARSDAGGRPGGVVF